MDPNRKLVEHPFWSESDPSRMRLVRFSGEFPPELNPFSADGVVIKAAGVPGEAQDSKFIIAREGIRDGIVQGLIQPDTHLLEATSGNTGKGMAQVAAALGLRFTAAVSADVTQDKINAIRVIGRNIALHVLADSSETTVEYARRLGAQDGWHNPCQYDGVWNWRAHYTYHAPRLWEHQGKISLLFVPGGTMGTSMGLKMYASDTGRGTKVIPVLCAPDEEVPGARTLESVKKDVRQPWETFFEESDLQFGTRHAAFYLSFLSWPHFMPHLGPTFGLAFAGALRFLQTHKSAGTLDQFRNEFGMIYVIVFGPDDCRPYLPLYLGELKKRELLAKAPPKDLISVLDK